LTSVITAFTQDKSSQAGENDGDMAILVAFISCFILVVLFSFTLVVVGDVQVM